jgi:hypothetical protein
MTLSHEVTYSGIKNQTDSVLKLSILIKNLNYSKYFQIDENNKGDIIINRNTNENGTSLHSLDIIRLNQLNHLQIFCINLYI